MSAITTCCVFKFESRLLTTKNPIDFTWVLFWHKWVAFLVMSYNIMMLKRHRISVTFLVVDKSRGTQKN
jgi:hypothetical protein